MEHSEAARSQEKGSPETSSPPPPINSSEIMRQQLTIFYAGQVVVFDDYPADKAHELIALASKSAPQNQINSNTIHEHPQVSSSPCDQSLIARRRASLCRFLECRKARTKKE